MRIHTDTLTYDDVLQAAYNTQGVYLSDLAEHGSRSRHHAFNVKLGGNSGRWVNSGQYGRGDHKAATWDQWGIFLAALYDKDPNMLAGGMYTSRDNFHERTERKYAA